MPHVASALTRLEALASALESVALAIETADAGALSACEATLDAAFGSAPTAVELSGHNRSRVAEQLRRTGEALDRCRTLGRATTGLIAASLSAQGIAPGYLPSGIGVPAPRLGRLEVRV